MAAGTNSQSSTRTPTSYRVDRSRSFTDLPETKTTAVVTSSHEHGRSDNLPHSPGNKTVNVILFGDAGVGKSAVINLIAQREVAEVSTDAQPCTFQTSCYETAFDGIDFRIFDTVGLDATRISSDSYSKALIKGFKLITDLTAAGGVHLLVFIMRSGRITATTQSNYLLFWDAVCQAKVPTVLVVTHLEEEVQMENWWIRNKSGIESYGIMSDGYACVTAVFDDTPGTDPKYTESQRCIRRLLKDCCLKDEAFLPEIRFWIARFGMEIQFFIKGKPNTKRMNVTRVLTDHCKLDLHTARRLADRMELQNLGEDAEYQNDGNESDMLMNAIWPPSPRDLIGRVKRSDSFPFASGGCGDIYRGICNLEGKSIQVAVKTCRVYLQHDERLSKENWKRFRREIAVWVTLRHPNVLRLLGIMKDPDLNPKIPAMVCPWVENGALSSYLEKNKDFIISKRLGLVNDVARGLQYLHSKQVVHGDLSGSNVLVRADGSACIADFGLSTLLTRIGGSTFSLNRSNKGTLRWMAPELVLDPGDSQIMPNMQSDVHSFGCLMLQILTGNIPYHYFVRDPQVISAIVKGEKPKRPNQTGITDGMWQFLERCWSPAKLRPSSDQVIEFISQELTKSMRGCRYHLYE